MEKDSLVAGCCVGVVDVELATRDGDSAIQCSET